MAEVSIIVPVYIPDEECAMKNDRFFRSLQEHTQMHYQLIVVDNGSKAGRLAGPGIPPLDILVNKPQPIGYARAVNIGLALADCDLVVVVNNDITLVPGWLEGMIGEYYHNEKIGPGVLSPSDGSPRGMYWTDSWYSLWMSDKRTLAKVGYLDESLPYRFHDQDYSIRMVKAGFRVQRTGKVCVHHDESSTYKKINLGDQEEQEGREMFRRYGYVHFIDWYNSRLR